MSLVRWKVGRWNDKPVRCEFERQTPHFYVPESGGNVQKISMNHRFFDTEAEALAAIVERDHSKLKRMGLNTVASHAAELLAALEALVNNADQNMPGCFTLENRGDFDAAAAMNAARAVIAKATDKLCYYAADGTLMNIDGTRSIFDDVDQ